MEHIPQPKSNIYPAVSCPIIINMETSMKFYRNAIFSIALITGVCLGATDAFCEENESSAPDPAFAYPAPDPPKIDGGLLPAADAGPLTRTSKRSSPSIEWTFHKSSDGVHPDGEEQQMLWLINRARSNPEQEGIWLATSDDARFAGSRDFFNVDVAKLQAEFKSYAAKPPAAFDVRLYNAANAHSADLIARDAQDHVGQFNKISAAGFQFNSARGNVFSFAKNGVNAHAGFNIDWSFEADGMQTGRGHRMAIMSVDNNYTNVGIASIPESNSATNVGPYVMTGNFCQANPNASDHFNRFIVGTVWEDLNEDSLYDPGEGKAGVTVMPDNGDYYAITGNSGGYAIPITSPGHYEVIFSGGSVSTHSATISVGDQSSLLDHQIFSSKSELVVTPSTLSVPSGAGTAAFSVSNGGSGIMNWHVSENAPWLTVTGGASGTNSGTVSISFSANAGNERAATITITAEGADNSPTTVQVTQASGVQPVLSVLPTSLTVPAKPAPPGGAITAKFTVANNGTGTMDWTASETESWITITSGTSGTNAGTITVSFETNSGAERTGKITVSSVGALNSPIILSVIQQNGFTPVLAVSPAVRNVPADGGSTIFQVANTGTGNLEWAVSENYSWLSVTGGTSGTNNGTITVACDANTGSSRTATLTIAAPGAPGSPAVVQIVQDSRLQPTLSVSPAFQNIASAGGTASFSVNNIGTGAMNWTVSETESWITITSGNTGTNGGTITLAVTQNTGAERKGTLTVTASGTLHSPASVEIIQESLFKNRPGDVDLNQTVELKDAILSYPIQISGETIFLIDKATFTY